MPTEKISGPPAQPCKNPEHDPPKNMVFEAGVYRHTCPGCGQQQIFTVRKPTW